MRDRSRIITRFAATAVLGLSAILALSNRNTLGFGTPAATAHPQRPVSNGVIAFVGGATNASLDTINSAGTRLRTLAYCRTTSCGIDHYIWSHDGRRIAFVRFTPDLSHLSYWHPYVKAAVFVVNADGSGEKRLVGCGSPRGCLAGLWFDWSPDDTRLVIARNGDLFVFNLKTHSLRQLTHCDTKCFDLEPRWSPDGSRIAFARAAGMCLFRCTARWYVVNVDRSGLKKLDNWPDIIWGEPSWSPDGHRIAFIVESHGLYTVDADGSHLRQLVPGLSWKSRRVSTDVSWDPSGARILYASTPRTHGPAQVWVIRPNGTARRLLYQSGSFGGYVTTAWSPAGKQIALSSQISADSHGIVDVRKSGLFILDAAGRHIRRVLKVATGDLAWQPVL